MGSQEGFSASGEGSGGPQGVRRGPLGPPGPLIYQPCQRQLAGDEADGPHVRLVVVWFCPQSLRRDCPGQKTQILAIKRPAGPYKNTVQNRFTVENAKAA
jgi:hypothetical protein